jgi:alanine racemase
MKSPHYRETWAEVSCEAIAHNAAQFKRRLNPHCRLMAVVKADGYGHGATQTARAALQGGANWLGVAFVDEAIALRNEGVAAPILILGYTPPAGVAAAIEHGAAMTVFSAEGIRTAMNYAQRIGKPAALHLKVDTGMNRLGGRSPEEALALAIEAADSPYVQLEGVYTHFAHADNTGSEFTRKQFRQFMTIVGHLEHHGIRVPLKHCCNTDGTLHFPEMHLDIVRVGIGLYGISSGGTSDFRNSLRPAMAVKTRISARMQIAAGETVGYGCTYTAERETQLAVLPIGYADGVARGLSNRGAFTIAGCPAPIRGRVCMDQTIVDVTDVPSAAVGDEAVLFGDPRQGSTGANDIAAITDTIGYEVICSVSRRVPRVYI